MTKAERALLIEIAKILMYNFDNGGGFAYKAAIAAVEREEK